MSNAFLNPSAAGAFADEITELSTDPDRIWQENNIGQGIMLFGFFLFKVGVDKKTLQPYCTLNSVSKVNVQKFIKKAGFRKRYLPDSKVYLMVRVENNILEEVTIDTIRVETFKEQQRKKEIVVYRGENEFSFGGDLLHTIYLQNQEQIFNKNFLELMEEYTVPELIDTRGCSYFSFKNEIIKVTASGFESLKYKELTAINRCVWKSHIKDRPFDYSAQHQTGEFEKFIYNVANHEPGRINAFKSGIGYLLHNYNGSHMGQAVVCYDEAPTDVRNPQGGTGKGLFAQGLAQMREAAKIDGRFIKADDKFRYQNVKVTSELVFVDDLSKDVPFDTFFSCLTDGWTIERKNEQQIKIEPEDSPKLLFSMNTVIPGNGSSHRRRIFILEFNNYYSKRILTGAEHPIEDEHGVLFDRLVWTSTDWDNFTAFMIDCLQFYLANGLQPYESINVTRNALIQTSGEDFAEWIEEKAFAIGPIYRTKDLFEEYRNRYYGPEADYKQRTFTNQIKNWAGMLAWDMKVTTDPGTKASMFQFLKKT